MSRGWTLYAVFVVSVFLAWLYFVVSALAGVTDEAFPTCYTSLPVCTIEWSANTEPDMESYRVYVRQAGTGAPHASQPTQTLQHPKATMFVSTLGLTVVDQLYAVAVSAVDKAGNESPKSPDVYFNLRTRAQPPSDLAPATPTLRLVIP